MRNTFIVNLWVQNYPCNLLNLEFCGSSALELDVVVGDSTVGDFSDIVGEAGEIEEGYIPTSPFSIADALSWEFIATRLL
jgi:hypothetical protein